MSKDRALLVSSAASSAWGVGGEVRACFANMSLRLHGCGGMYDMYRLSAVNNVRSSQHVQLGMHFVCGSNPSFLYRVLVFVLARASPPPTVPPPNIPILRGRDMAAAVAADAADAAVGVLLVSCVAVRYRATVVGADELPRCRLPLFPERSAGCRSFVML